MSFGDPRMLWLLLVLPPGMLVFFGWSARKRSALMQQFIRARLLPGLVAGVSGGRQRIRMGGLVLAVICLILALARPRWGYQLQEVTQRGLDIVVAIDTSKSMMAQDIVPNRLARAKLAALDLMQQAKSDRLGLVAFAGTAFLQCPLTIDDTAFRESLEALSVNTIPEGGTALAQAIATAQGAFKEGDNYRILVMFTDGEDLEPGAVAAAKAAAVKGLRIFTIGVGTAEGDLIRVPDSKGQVDFVRDENGNVVKSHLNKTLLEDIARATTGGFYLPLQGANTIDVLYQRGLAPLPRSESKERWLRRPQERYQWPLALAIVLLVSELLFPERKRLARTPSGRETGGVGGAGNAAARRRATAAAGSALVSIGLLASGSATASPASALREYQSGKYDEALKQYEQSLQKQSDDLRLHFNAGAAAYRDQKFDQAARYFGDALTSPDLKLQQPAYYNLGNTLYHLGEQNPDPQKKKASWEDALKQFESAIKLNTNDADAGYNYKYVKERLEELKKQQQQQQQQNQDQQNQNQNQPNQQDQQNSSSKDKQQNQQSKSDQQQNSQSQKDQNPQAGQQQRQEQQQANSQKPDQQQQQQASREKQEAENQAPKKDPQQAQEQKGQESADKGSDQEQASAPGQMTPREAKQLLDSQKDKDSMLPVSRKQETADQQRAVRDW